MKILVFSDIHFPSVLFRKNKEFVKNYFLTKNNELKNFTSFINSSKIDLILIAGDVMGDFGGDIFLEHLAG
ncbi:MAG: metallophosphoesterase [Bacteroidetes bacterium]|nr:metallophosphoesterase [Bacteroidota bacterium]